MISFLFVAFTSLLTIYIFAQYRSFLRNLQAAKRSGFAYRLAPFSFQQPLWLATQNLLKSIFRYLPAAWSETWLPFSVLGEIWSYGHTSFTKAKSDTVLLVAPSGNVLYTCDPDIISQVTARRRDFPKPMSLLKMLNIYGPTLSGSEGEEARLYKKITGPSFNEKTHHQVWTESLSQTRDMLVSLTRASKPLKSLSDDMAKLALHVISKVFFDKTMTWTNEGHSKESLPNRRILTYQQSINAAIENNSILFLTPKFVLDLSPLLIHRKAKQAYTEWREHMLDMLDKTRLRLRESKSQSNPSLLEVLVQAGNSGTDAENISEEAILGNIHLFILAGHETAANTLAIAISLLAYHPEIQLALQKDLDSILGDPCVTRSLEFEKHYPRLINGYTGALLYETLRLYPTLPFITKTTESEPRELATEDDKQFVVPADTLIVINIAAAHRNPQYWSSNCSSFDPSRWLDAESRMWLSPRAGTYLPFSEGFRSCVGKRFAQVEFCAVISSIFSEYSVRLADGSGGGDRLPLEDMDSRMELLMTLKMGTDAPLQFIKREEREA